MPIPQEQRRQLERDLREHEDRNRMLRRDLQPLQDEMRTHQEILDLGRDRTLMDALNELYDDPDLIEEIADHPRRYFLQRGVRLPPN